MLPILVIGDPTMPRRVEKFAMPLFSMKKPAITFELLWVYIRRLDSLIEANQEYVEFNRHHIYKIREIARPRQAILKSWKVLLEDLSQSLVPAELKILL